MSYWPEPEDPGGLAATTVMLLIGAMGVMMLIMFVATMFEAP